MAVFSSNTNHGYTLKLTVNEDSYSVNDNTSTISYSLVLYSTTKRYRDYTTAYSVTIDGEKVVDVSNQKTSLYATNSSFTVVSGTKIITHNADGTKSFSVAFSFSTANDSYAPGSLSGSGTVTLTAIPRNSRLSGDRYLTIGKNTTFRIQRYSNSFTHTLTYVPNGNSEITIATGIKADSFSWTVSKGIYNLIPNARKILGVIYLYTYNGSTLIGIDSIIVTFQIDEADCTPTFSPTAFDTWENVISVTGDKNRIVNIYNKVQVSFNNPTAKNGATITSKKVVCGSKSLSGDGIMNGVNSGDFTFTVTDSRGLSKTVLISKPFVNYYRPTISLTVGNITPDGECTLKMNGISFIGKFGNTSNAKTNSPSIVLWQKEQGSDYGDAIKTIAISDSTYSVETVIDNLDYKKTYVFKAQVRDTLVGAAGQTDEKAGNGLPVFCWNNNEFNFNVPVNMNSLKQTTFAENGFSINIIRLGNIVQVFMEAKMNQIPDIVTWSGYRLLTLPNGYRPILRVWTRLLSDGNNTWQDNYYWNIYPDGGVSIRTRNKAIDGWTSLGDGHGLWLSATFITNDSLPTD